MPIPGTRSAKRVEERVAAADLALTDADLARITEILLTDGFGSRLPEGMSDDWSDPSAVSGSASRGTRRDLDLTVDGQELWARSTELTAIRFVCH